MYSKLITLHGEMKRKTRLEWVEKAIEILENEGSNIEVTKNGLKIKLKGKR